MTEPMEQTFRQLQTRLYECWQGTETFIPELPTGPGGLERDIVVIPSLSFAQPELAKIPGYTHYEERQLYTLIQLRNPRTRMVYVTSQPLHPSIVDYYLDLLPGVPTSHARDRLLLLATYDRSEKPLTAKILERPRLIERIRQSLRPGKAYMVCFNSTPLERDLAMALGIPLYSTDPDLLHWGTKAGSRELFAAAHIPHPDGSGLVYTVENLVTAIAQLWSRHPHLERMVVKLNEAFSGEGNALLDLRPLRDFAPGTRSQADQAQAITTALEALDFQAPNQTWDSYRQRLEVIGAIVESFIEGKDKRSPSVQGCITPNGDVDIISTHDQILNSPEGQIFIGCRFPAEEGYRLTLQTLGRRVGQYLAEQGVIGYYGVDFIAQTDAGSPFGWDVQAIEINLRKGGTTHPFMTLKFLTDGAYQPDSGLFLSKHGRPKFYIASDNLCQAHYRGLLPNDLLDMIARYHLHFDSSTETGTVFHLMGALSEFGKLGLVSVGNSLPEAELIYEQAIAVLDAAVY
ncbi:peptide ligase PGM1-related protein [Candidatus Synechococcus calcipolaris G9]|uniref:Peptide ligase PGM1-related protein n=1 Tax=Candidatus Synechococcus calcipolaris G9 TaxID=1497997 RepID=A0ABT6EW71_9SYNE|nr:peptide ligase PGM1-related protein [Candidatus Synechococcus calcipolaris]MDG2990026.1 peptide ligase PGM1-related protein [Candidatus Synechococcus calcipolaris G9]